MLGFFFMFDLLPFFSPSFLVTTVTFGQEKERRLKQHFFAMSP